MMVKKITLRNFRNFDKAGFTLHPFTTVIRGKNSVGKTNLLEAIYFLVHGKGIKEEKQEELMQLNSSETLVEGEGGGENENYLFLVRLDKDETGLIKKTHFVNKIKKRLHEYSQETPPLSIFTPKLISVIDGNPQERRKFVDNIISVYDINYKKSLLNYESGLRKRNKILETETNKLSLRERLHFWDELLIKEAAYITEARRQFIKHLNKKSNLHDYVFTIVYNEKTINRDTLEASFEKQFLLKKTLVGPQRDDYQIYKDGKNIHSFGSRSEQRLALFWLILNEVDLYQEKLKKNTLVLLDDIFSELDEQNKNLIIDLIKKNQTVLTTTEEKIADLIAMPHSVIDL